MDEKQPAFTVTDRRKFTLDGDLRDESSPLGPPAEPAPAPVAADNVVTMPAPAREEQQQPEPEPPAEEPELPQFTAHETAEQNAAYAESSRQIDDLLRQSNPGIGPQPAVSFEHIIQSFYVSAMIAMGAATEPGQKPRVDIIGARQSIDMLALLQEKTKGNLTQKEDATLQNVLFELRMMFLEITNAIAAQAQRGPAPGKQ
jgi:hypothetical protein